MTLAESKMTKMMRVQATIGRVDLTGLWFKICILPAVKVSHANGKTMLNFEGTIEDGLYVIKEIALACEATKSHFRLEVSHYFSGE